MGRGNRSAIRVPTRQTLSQVSPCGDLAGSSDGARQAHRAAQDGDAATLQGSRLHEENRGRHLWRNVAQLAGAGKQASSSCPLVQRLWLLPAADRRIWLEQPALAP